MNQQLLIVEEQDIEAPESRASGAELARTIPFQGRRVVRAPKAAKPVYMRRILTQRVVGNLLRLLNDNLRLIRTAEKESSLRTAQHERLPLITNLAGQECMRVQAIAIAYLDHVQNRFSEETCAAFLDGFQDVAVLEIAELWALKPALQREILERLAQTPDLWPDLFYSLRQVGEIAWKELFEAVNRIDRVLAGDPVGAYSGMDFESRNRYRTEIAGLAKLSPASEQEVAIAALSLAQRAFATSDGSRAGVRRAHVGYYLVDEGLERLRAEIGYRPTIKERIKNVVSRNPAAFYLISIELITFGVAGGILGGLDSRTPIFLGLLLLLLPATQVAVNFINSLVSLLFAPRTLPRLDFTNGVPPECTTMVAVPTLLLNEAQVRDLVLDLEIRYLANRDPQIYFALLTDWPDADTPFDERDRLVDVCTELIEGLNSSYAGSPFFLLHRHRAYNEKEGRWMGWERKRGKLLDLNRLLRGGFDSFPVKIGDVSVLPRIRYVLTLDSDTQLPRDSAAQLIGTIAHPLNAAVVDPMRRVVVEGYGILQPRIGISIQSAARSNLAALYSGETGFDIYTRAVSDVYQDLFGEAIFTGKGIYEVDALREVLEQSFPENALLSHDLIEGAYARAALISDIELIDDYPSHFSAYNRRKHRWVRGDWQIVRWLGDRVPNRALRLAPNPISIISWWKILDNLRRSLQEPSLIILFLSAWLFLPGSAVYWTLAAAAMPFIAANSALLVSVFRTTRCRDLRSCLHDLGRALKDANISALFNVVFLLHQALISADAIVRSILRMFVTGHKLLEWETAAEAEAARSSKATVDLYLEWTPPLSIAIGLVVWLVRPDVIASAAPILALWAGSRALSAWLNLPPRATNCELNQDDVQWLREYGEKMCRFFRDWSSPTTNWLIPDNVREDGPAAMTLSPTNVGILLNARIAAVHFGVLTLQEFVLETSLTLERLTALPKHRGHLLNWYDVSTLEPAPGSRFVSTVDSGNLAACLWTLKQAALGFAAESPAKRGLTPEIAAELGSIAGTCDRQVHEMDFRFLYEPRKKALSVGYDLDTGRLSPSYYDLLASESRIATFIAIAKGDIPQEAWFHLGRAHTLCEGERVLLSWTGTMFEYLMPAIWMRSYPGTILDNSIRGSIRTQREYARRKGVPWGISESAHLLPDGSYGYAPFGIPNLALKRSDSEKLVISPYSAFLSVAVDPAASLKNLKQIEEYGWTGRYGFFEAIDYTRSGGEPVRSWMAHHQGMSLLAVCNLLFDQPFQRCFHAEPHVLATELLLHERIPATMRVDKEEPAPLRAVETESAAA